MRKVISTLFVTLGLAIPAASAADSTAIADSFSRDANRNHVELSPEIYANQDTVQANINRALNGSDFLYASFNNDLYRVATPTQPISNRTDSVQQQINIALQGYGNPLVASFKRDLYRIATANQQAVQASDITQQYVNRALGNTDALYASFNLDLYRVATPSEPIGKRHNNLQQQILKLQSQ